MAEFIRKGQRVCVHLVRPGQVLGKRCQKGWTEAERRQAGISDRGTREHRSLPDSASLGTPQVERTGGHRERWGCTEHVACHESTWELTGTAAPKVRQPSTVLHPIFTQPSTSNNDFHLHCPVYITIHSLSHATDIS